VGWLYLGFVWPLLTRPGIRSALYWNGVAKRVAPGCIAKPQTFVRIIRHLHGVTEGRTTPRTLLFPFLSHLFLSEIVGSATMPPPATRVLMASRLRPNGRRRKWRVAMRSSSGFSASHPNLIDFPALTWNGPSAPYCDRHASDAFLYGVPGVARLNMVLQRVLFLLSPLTPFSFPPLVDIRWSLCLWQCISSSALPCSPPFASYELRLKSRPGVH